MNKINPKMNKEDVGYIEPNKFYLYYFSIINQITEKEFKIGIKLEESKIVIEISIDKDAQNAIFSKFMKLMNQKIT